MTAHGVGVGLVAVGTVLQLLGIGFTGVTLADTREQFAPGAPGIVGTIGRWGASVRRWVERRVRVALHRHDSVVVHAGTATGNAYAAMNASVRVTYGPRTADITTAEALALLDERLRRMQSDLHTLEDASRADRATDTAARAKAHEDTATVLADLRNEMVTGFTGGLRRESAGLLIAALGIIVAGIGGSLM